MISKSLPNDPTPPGSSHKSNKISVFLHKCSSSHPTRKTFYPTESQCIISFYLRSPNKGQYARKPMISGPGSRGGSNLSPSLLVSPRNQNQYQCYPLGSNNGSQMRGFQQELCKPQFSGKSQGSGLLGMMKKTNQNSNEIKFVMSKAADYCENHGNKVAEFEINIEG
jgi:hypothetical protein